MTENLTSRLLTGGLVYGEGPRWHDDRLWVTDGPAGAVKVLTGDGRLEVAVETGHPSGLGWLPDGSMVISTLMEASVKRVDAGGQVTVHDLSHLAWSTNDMVAGPDGSIYVDLYRIDGEVMTGQIALVTAAGEARVVASDLVLPNGLVITPDGGTLISADTGTSRIHAYRIDADGGLADRRVFADLGPDRHPDGLCLDAEGAVWVGCFDTAEFLRVLDGGQVTHRVGIGADWAVAPALGGPDGRTLYLVVNDTSIERLPAGDSVGRIETVRVAVPGAGRLPG